MLNIQCYEYNLLKLLMVRYVPPFPWFSVNNIIFQSIKNSPCMNKMVFAAYNCDYFVQNNEILCWIQLCFHSANFVIILFRSMVKTLYPAVVGAKLRCKITHRIVLPQGVSYVNIDCDLVKQHCHHKNSSHI